MSIAFLDEQPNCDLGRWLSAGVVSQEDYLLPTMRERIMGYIVGRLGLAQLGDPVQ